MRKHFPRFDTSICPNPDQCEHTTEQPGECCECCGRVIEPEPEHADVCRANRGGRCNCARGASRQPFSVTRPKGSVDGEVSSC